MKNPYLNLISKVWHYGKSWRGAIIGYYFAYIIAQIFLSSIPYIFGRTVDVLQNFTPDRLSEVILWLSCGVAAVLFFWIFHGPARVVERKVALKIQQNFRMNLYEQFTHLPLKWHQKNHSGNIITRVNRASLALYRFAGDQFMYIETIIKLLASIGFLLWISLTVGLLTLITCFLSITIVLLFDRKLIVLYNTQNEIDNRVGGVFFDYMSNMTTVLTLRLGALTRNNLFKRIMDVWPFFNKEVVLNEVKWFSNGMVLNIMQATILIFYIIYTLHAHQAILIGTVVMIFRYQGDLNEVFYTLSATYGDLVRMNTDVEGMNTILADIKQFAHLPQGEAVVLNWHTLKIDDLNFHHVSSESRGKLKNINFNIKRGEKIALIGSSGGGKSTLLNILSGLYTPDKVNLIIDDDTTFDSFESLQSITTLIPQDPEIFENTIEFNITMDLETTPEEINRIIVLSEFESVLKLLPLGLDTDICEKGLNLSVGQKQRLALARGLFAARFSSLILMDEPTSSLDLATENRILVNVINEFSNTAMIVSLHRLHLLPKFDRIIMLDHGKIVADGSPKELLSTPGPVFDLWSQYR